ncbi:hypothetical protein Golax_023422, partial [Gossypium laxum]|nr:hypothetical protein [Gossypium laxum]
PAPSSLWLLTSCPVPAAPKNHCCLFAYPTTGQPPPFAHPAQSPARCELELAQPRHRRMIEWCPAPECEYAVDFTVASGNLIALHCNGYLTYAKSWSQCPEKAHRYVDAKWILKNSAESENMDW